MKEKCSFQECREALKSPSLRIIEKEKAKVLKRKYDTGDSSHGRGPTLEEQFQNIVDATRTSTVSKIIKNKIKRSLSSKHVSPKNEPKALEDCSTPARPHKGCDVAPSPITPPLPKRMRRTPEDVGEAPSPAGMGDSPLTQPSNVHHVQALFIKDDSGEIEEGTFFDAQDTSVVESGAGLNLDGLIDEIFVNRTNCLDGVDKAEDPLECTSAEECIGASEADTQSSDLPTIEDANRVEAANTEGKECEHLASVLQQDKANESEFGESKHVSSVPLQDTVAKTASSDSKHPASVPLQDKSAEVSPKICHSDVQLIELGEEETQIKIASPDGNHENILLSSPNPTIIATHSSEGITNDTTNVEQAALPVLDISVEVSEPIQDSTIEVFLREKGFSDDFELSESQILAIDAKCGLAVASPSKPSANPILKDPPSQSEGNQNNNTKSFEVESTQPEKNSIVIPNPTLGLGFALPPAPRLDWTQKALESRQRLRMITQEISRLNAMVLRARRTLWPQQQQDVQIQHVTTPSTSVGNSQLQPVTLQHVSQPPQVFNLDLDPEWNRS